MSATDQMRDGELATPLSETMLTMHMVDALARSPDMANNPDSTDRLRDLYASLGISVTDAQLGEGLAAYRNGQFAYAPPPGGVAVLAARLYVQRRRWLPAVTSLALMLIIGFGGYFLVYKPYRDGQIAALRAELATTIPAQLDELYQTVFQETKIQQATAEAAEQRDEGKEAALKGDRNAAESALANLTAIRDTLRLVYQLRVVDRPGVKWGFWTFPEDNTEATNYYIVVEARAQDGKTLILPIKNEQTGRTETVAMWGLRVPEEVYRAVESDKNDDGVIEHYLVGAKDFGFLEPDYVVDVIGGAVTRW